MNATRRTVYFHEDGSVEVKRGKVPAVSDVPAYEVTKNMALVPRLCAMHAVSKPFVARSRVWCALCSQRDDPHGTVLELRGLDAKVEFGRSTKTVKKRYLESQVDVILEFRRREKRNAPRYVRLSDAEEYEKLPERAVRITPDNVDAVASFQTTEHAEIAFVRAAFAERAELADDHVEAEE